MKNIQLRSIQIIIAVSTSIGLFFSSCNDKIDFGGDIVQVPILYSVLDQADEIHYVKLTKSIAGDQNSVDVAKIADSNYFKNAVITISEVISNAVTRKWTLRDTIVTGKLVGDDYKFYGPDQKVYYFSTKNDKPLDENAKYKINVNINDGEFFVTGETNLIKGMEINTPQKATTAFKFYENDKYSSYPIKYNAGNAAVVNTYMNITYLETELNSGVTLEKSFKWNLGDKSGEQISNSVGIVSASGEQFFGLFKQFVPERINDIKERRLKSIELIVTGGSLDFYNHSLVNQPSTSIAQNKPTFTNLKTSDGRTVVGLFASRHRVSQFKIAETQFDRAIDQKSTEILCQGTLTSKLGFCSGHPTDLQEIFACK